MIDVEAEIVGLEDHVKRLRRLDPKKQRRVLRAAFRGYSSAIATRLRRYIRQRIRRIGHLLKAIRTKVKSYPSGVVVILVGARNRKLADGENPGNYFHLADAGTRPHTVPLTTVRVNGVLVRLDEPYEVQHPGSEPADARGDALRTSRKQADARMVKNYDRQLRKCVSQ